MQFLMSTQRNSKISPKCDIPDESTPRPYALFSFFFNTTTFDHKRQFVCEGITVPIDFVGFDDQKPYKTFATGDELFIVGLKASRVMLAGRMVIAGPAEARADVIAKTSRDNCIMKHLICF